MDGAIGVEASAAGMDRGIGGIGPCDEREVGSGKDWNESGDGWPCAAGSWRCLSIGLPVVDGDGGRSDRPGTAGDSCYQFSPYEIGMYKAYSH
jgi:hypothetical protein